jgi:hypothetical protein
VPMAKTTTVPDTHTLKVLVQEYLDTLKEAERGIKKLLSLDPHEEAYWDQLSELDPTITLIESSSGSIREVIDDLIDQLPED